MRKFYGHASSRNEMDLWSKLTITKLAKKIHIDWPGTEEINLKDFFELTSPTFYVYHCQFERIDCRNMWKKVTTINGICLEFDPLKVSDAYHDQVSRQSIKDKDFEFE